MNATEWLPPHIRAAARERTLEPGQALFRAGQRTAGFYEILSGRVRLVRVDRSGREAVLHSAGPGETTAEASLFSPTYHCDAVAMTTARIRLYPKPAVLAELESNPGAARAFMARLAHQVMGLRAGLERRNIHSARDRVRHFLALGAGADGCTVAVPGTLKELAADLGLTHEALYRTLARMTADGEIRRLKGKIRLMQGI